MMSDIKLLFVLTPAFNLITRIVYKVKSFHLAYNLFDNTDFRFLSVIAVLKTFLNLILIYIGSTELIIKNFDFLFINLI